MSTIIAMVPISNAAQVLGCASSRRARVVLEADGIHVYRIRRRRMVDEDDLIGYLERRGIDSEPLRELVARERRLREQREGADD